MKKWEFVTRITLTVLFMQPEFEFLVAERLIGGLKVGGMDHVAMNSFRLGPYFRILPREK
jgi:hypothetical protein